MALLDPVRQRMLQRRYRERCREQLNEKACEKRAANPRPEVGTPEWKTLRAREREKEHRSRERIKSDPRRAELKRQEAKRYRQRHKGRLSRESKLTARKLRLFVLMTLGGKCTRCGINDMRVLQVDHINGGGSAERRRDRKGGGEYCRHILRNLSKFQLLCANCNWIKRWENDELSRAELKEA